MNVVVRALGIGTRIAPPITHFSSPLPPGRPLRSPGCPLRDDPRVESPHAMACSVVGEVVDAIEAERAQIPIARARGPVAGFRKEPA
jgi:hypothetical protein